jgi:hypothetical protein
MAIHLARHALLVVAFLVVAHPVGADSVRVTAAQAAVRLNPAAESPIIGTFKAGTILEIKGKEGEWYGVLLPADAQGLRRYGYVEGSLVEPFDERAGMSKPDAAQRPPQTPPAFDPVQFANAELPLAKEGVYVGFRYSNNDHRAGGDFDGLHFVRFAEEVLAVPQLGSAGGPAFLVGYRMAGGAIEVAYLRSTHPGVWSGLSGTGRYQALDVDGKYHLFANKRIQPYLLGGLGFSWLRVLDGVFPLSSGGGTGDGTLTGVGFNGGAGVAVYPHPRVSVSGGASYRLDVYTRAKGSVNDWTDINEAFIGRGVRINGGIAFTF